jgi:outer membrane murein-binding lipoprotein Lpp
MVKYRIRAALMALTLLSGCASYAHDNLKQDQVWCQQGDKVACERLPQRQAEANLETAKNNETAGNVALGLLLLPILALAVVAAAQPPQPDVVVICRWRC